MKRFNLHFLRIACMLFTALFLVSLSGVTDTVAEENLNNLLKGDYAFSLFQSCVNTPVGFDEGTLQLLSDGRIAVSTIQVVVHYNGDGTASAEGKGLSIGYSSTSAGDIPAVESDLTCNVTYAVNPDRISFIHEWEECNGIITSGPAAGVEFVLTESRDTGSIGLDRHALSISDSEANVEKVSIPAFSVVTKRICTRSGTAVKIR